jgi:hypothetical protein
MCVDEGPYKSHCASSKDILKLQHPGSQYYDLNWNLMYLFTLQI